MLDKDKKVLYGPLDSSKKTVWGKLSKIDKARCIIGWGVSATSFPLGGLIISLPLDNEPDNIITFIVRSLFAILLIFFSSIIGIVKINPSALWGQIKTENFSDRVQATFPERNIKINFEESTPEGGLISIDNTWYKYVTHSISPNYDSPNGYYLKLSKPPREDDTLVLTDLPKHIGELK